MSDDTFAAILVGCATVFIFAILAGLALLSLAGLTVVVAAGFGCYLPFWPTLGVWLLVPVAVSVIRSVGR